MSESVIVYGLCAAIVSLAVYIAALYKWNAKSAKEDKIRHEELLVKMITAMTQSTSVIENNSKVIEENTNALNIVKYKK